MTKKLFRSILLATIGVFLSSLILIMGVLYRYFTEVETEQLQTQTTLAAQGISLDGEDYFDSLKTSNVRITWVDNTGKVLHDTKSNPAKMSNHGNREEIKEALKDGYGESTRYSSTLTQRSLYVAQRLDNGTIVRLSVTERSILLLLLGMLQPLILIVVLALLLSILVARYTAKKLVLPLNRLNLEEPLANDVYEEISPLLRRIDRHQKELQKQDDLLTRRKQEFDTIISKIREGMILLDEKRSIISINTAAMQLFQTDKSCLGKDILEITRDIVLNQLLEEGLTGKKKEGVATFGKDNYRVLIRPITADSKVTGVMILLFDVTDQLQAENMRREFTANVSHELKTPLHLIAGYSEMMTNDLVSSQDVRQFSEKIYIESQRMIQLVEDIINLSHLDESSQVKMETVDLYQVTKNVLDTLSSRATQKKVSLNLSGQTALVRGNPALLHSVIYNLCDNAIKYNREHGEVFVSVKPQQDTVVLEVRDTGIGIDDNEQERIFERFYRVDKSRSKKVGGTGLGLSIVKHALQIHDAAITVQSTQGKGTTMTVTFKGESGRK